jgi:uncharacterized protein YcbX
MEIEELWRYPVKSMGGKRLSEAAVGPLGIAGDRVVVVVRDNRIVTARTRPQLLRHMGQAMPSTVYCSTVWTKRGAKWVAVYHQESAAAAPQMKK